MANNGSIGSSFYQNRDFYATSDITVLTNEKLNAYNSMLIITIIQQEKYRFNYGRKWSNSKLKNSKIKIPIDNKGNPDWNFMEYYIKSLPYSINLVNDQILS